MTPNWRSQVQGRIDAGQTPKQVENELGIPASTCATTHLRAPERDENNSKHRSGRSGLMTTLLRRNLLREVRANPEITYKKLRVALGLHGKAVSKATLYREIKKHGITNWIAKKRPLLTPEVVAKRLKWAQDHEHWGKAEWKKFLWSDECSVERGSGKSREWCFRTPAQKWDKEMIQTYKKGKDKTVMVWACFGGNGARSNLVFMPGDPDSKKGDVTSLVYIEVLADEVPTLWEPGLIFMQDNAPIHTARIIKAWFEENGIEVEEWPPYSPDMNPIEHVWKKLKKWVHEHHPELETMTGDNVVIKQRMLEALQEGWDALPQDFLDKLVESMEDRVKALLKAEGWHTKY